MHGEPRRTGITWHQNIMELTVTEGTDGQLEI